MKPNFALVLSFDGIGLLHRAPVGWHMVGEVALDTSDLAPALAVLRRTATQLDSEGLRSKLVIPNEQIRYLTLPAPARGTDMAAHVAASLDGATPYDVADLRFDWVSVGDQLHVAAVALETLDEASSFATEHGFAPVSYVAIPPADTFPGEPFFGLTPEAATLIRPGDRLLRDTHAIRIIGPAERPTPADVPVETPVDLPTDVPTNVPAETRAAPATAEINEPTPVADTALAEAVAPDPQLTRDAPVAPGAPEAQPSRFSLIEPPAPEVAEALAADTDAPDDDAPTTAQAPDQPAPVDPVATVSDQGAAPKDAAPLPRFSTRRDRTEPPLTARKPIVAELPPLPELNAEGWTGLPGDLWGATDTETEEDAPPPRPTPPLVARKDGGAQDADNAAALTPAPFISPPAPEPATQDDTAAGLTGALLARLARKGAPDPEAEAETTPASPRKAARTKVKPTHSERQRLTVFGARKPEVEAAAIGGKPRYLGVVLTGILVLFLAAVGAWSAMFGDSGLRGFFGQTTPDIAEATATPDRAAPTPAEPVAMAEDIRQPPPAALPETETATAPPPETATTNAPTASDTPTPLPTGDLPSDLAQLPPPSPQEARQAALSSYAATGIWQIAPDQPEAPVSQSLDTLYLASIDSSLQNLDAVALPDIRRALSDVRPEAQSNPAAPGKQFDLDARGLVIATPEGAETPEGVIVYTGRPPLTPPGIPTRFAQTPQANAQPEPDLAGVRPRLRPDTLIESNERATLGGLSRSELAGLRPRARPETLAAVALALREADQAEVEADEADAQDTGTDQAIASSLKPLARPRDLTTGNDSAAAAPRPAAAAALAPQRNAAPQIPSSASVAQQATVRGAINLRQVNLIGVYGQPSNRRALVRLSNGRYQKVQVGDRLDGGQVRAIGENELSYVKNNRAIVLTMPNG